MDAAVLSGDGMVSRTLVDRDPWAVAARVEDPELPFVTIEDLGILRSVVMSDDGRVTVTVTPTYSGCPATEVIRDSVLAALVDAGYADAEVRTVFSPAWSTDDVTPEGRRKLEEGGIAPPGQPVLCPRCRAESSRLVAEFGSTACKALRVCERCLEPFDHFKDLK